MDYPARPRFFAFKFCRLMAKLCLANEIGPDACWLLATIAMCEDARGYCGPVSYYNDQLAPLIGSGSVDSLDRVRIKAVRSGWLDYEPGRKGVAGRYAVKIPPQFCGRMEAKRDAAFDEQPSEYIRGNAETTAEASAEETERKAGGNRGGNREETAEHSSLSLSLPNTHHTGNGHDLITGTRLDTPDFRSVWGQWTQHVLAKTGKRLNEIAEQAQLVALARLGVDKAIRDVKFSIEKNASSLLDSDNDFQRTRDRKPNAPRKIPKDIKDDQMGYNPETGELFVKGKP